VERRRILYSGWVQGVGFRYTALRLAGGYEVSGFVRNLRDGRVELVAEGDPGTLDVFLERIATTLSEYIDHAEVEVTPATASVHGFEIRR
jgi:acylphosphatase